MIAMPRDYLLQILEDDGDPAPQEAGPQRRARNLEEIMAKFDAEGVGLDAGERLRRRELYGRRVSLRDQHSDLCRQHFAGRKGARDMGRRSLQVGHRTVAAPPRHKPGEMPNCHNSHETGNSQPPVMYSRNPEAPGGDGSGACKRLRRHASRLNRQSGDGAGTSCNQRRNRPARLPGPVPASGKRT